MVTESRTRKIEILLVEDSPGDVRLTREALREGKACSTSSRSSATASRGALDYLFQRNRHVGAPRPDLILLDLNLPKKDGREVLSEIKADRALKRIPVVVLTTSQSEEDVLRSYDLHANCYIPKPVDFERFIEVVRSIDAFWLTVVKLPPE